MVKSQTSLLLISLGLLLFFILIDVEVAELVGGWVDRHNAQPVTKLFLLEVLLGQVLDVSLGHSNIGVNNNLIAVSSDSNLVLELANLTVNLDGTGKELNEVVCSDNGLLTSSGEVEDELL